MDAIPGRKRLVVGIRQQDGQHDLLQQRERHVGGAGHDDGNTTYYYGPNGAPAGTATRTGW